MSTNTEVKRELMFCPSQSSTMSSITLFSLLVLSLTTSRVCQGSKHPDLPGNQLQLSDAPSFHRLPNHPIPQAEMATIEPMFDISEAQAATRGSSSSGTSSRGAPAVNDVSKLIGQKKTKKKSKRHGLEGDYDNEDSAEFAARTQIACQVDQECVAQDARLRCRKPSVIAKVLPLSVDSPGICQCLSGLGWNEASQTCQSPTSSIYMIGAHTGTACAWMEQLSDEEWNASMSPISLPSQQLHSTCSHSALVLVNLTITVVYDIWRPLFESPGKPGYHEDLLNLIATDLGLHIRYIPNPYPGIWGKKLPDGSWTGMLALLANGQADICVSGAIMTPERDEIIDYTTPTANFRTMLFIGMAKAQNLNLENYNQEFTATTWLAIGVGIGGSWLVLSGLIHVHQGSASLREAASLAFEIVLRACLQKGTSILKTSRSLKVGMLTFLLFAMMTFNVYKCQMNAFLAVIFLESPIKTLLDAYQADLDIGYFNGDAIEEFFANSPPGSLAYRIHQKRLDSPRSQVTSYAEGLANLREGDYAFLQQYEAMIKEDGYGTDFLEAEDFAMRTDVVMPVKKNSIYLEAFNEQILKYMQNGVLEKLTRKYLKDASEVQNTRLVSATRLGLTNVVTPFLLLAGGILIATTIVALEMRSPQIDPNVPYPKSIEALQLQTIWNCANLSFQKQKTGFRPLCVRENGGQKAWRPRSPLPGNDCQGGDGHRVVLPDCLPLDYGIWGYVESKGCRTPHKNVSNLKAAMDVD
eukprot:maker-scaffold234_size243041-snap-gene-1.25 protein:Tk10941 transcript:maker-scaffold234_size243041-snap-gene-1.25-mRNA-1 annotation:"hypothetical protein Y032_0887g2867"